MNIVRYIIMRLGTHLPKDELARYVYWGVLFSWWTNSI